MADYKKTVTELLGLAGVTVNGSAATDLRVHDERFYRRFLSGGRMAMGESYMDGWWDCDDIAAMFTKIFSAQAQIVSHIRTPGTMLMALAGKLMPYGSMSRSKHVGEFHYDLGNEMYERFLDPYMQYSCAYWGAGAKSLEEAQRTKLDRICRKLRLAPGQSLLDIGCGWGGLIKYASEHHKVSATGISISKEQLAYAEKFCAGLPAAFKFQDYRAVNEQYDRIVSVGMMEHVGKSYYRAYMESIHKALKDDGIALVHTIGFNTSDFRNPWLQKYIFPGCFVPSIKQVGEAYEGLFVLEHVENIGHNYAPTLLAWYENFARNWAEIQKSNPQQYNDRFYRMWKYYLLSCAAGFGARKIQVWQFVLSKNGVPGGYRFEG